MTIKIGKQVEHKSGFFISVYATHDTDSHSKIWEIGPFPDEQVVESALLDMSSAFGMDKKQLDDMMYKICDWSNQFSIDHFYLRYYDEDGIGYYCEYIP